MPLTAPQWLEILRQYRLLPPERDGDTARLAAAWPPERDFLEELERRGCLTAFQRGMIARNRSKELVLGPYVLLELLGEGGAGQVYKARHTLLNRLVALKILRPDRIGPAELERFQREMQTAAKLSHSHIVLAYDAVQAGDHLVYAMELVQGTDLSKLVKERGPLTIGQACSWARQAALGLQHIHEHGLVHRDIKPGNLLLAQQTAGPPLLKVADLGLARLQSAWSTDADGLTATGAVMGTPDFMPPEQAVDPRHVDIRGDLYSLGCTLYFLLTGQVPFPGGSLPQKIAWHQHAEPAPVEQIRKDVPEPLAQVVRRLMAKKPAQRFQTPVEAAAALASFCGQDGSTSGPGMLTRDTLPFEGKSSMAATGFSRGRVGLLAGLAAAALALVLILWLNRDRSPGPAPSGAIQVQLVGWLRPADSKGVVFLLDDKAITPEDLEKTLSLLAGKHVLTLQRDGKEVERRDFVVTPDLHLGKLVLPEPEAPVGPLHVLRAGDEVTAIGYSGDGLRLLAVGPVPADGVHVWETPTGRLIHHFARGLPKAGGKVMKGVPVSGALSPEGNVVLLGHLAAYKSVKQKAWFRALALESKTLQIETAEHPKTVRCVVFSRDGALALSACEAGETRLWDAKSWTKKFQHDGNLACFTSDAAHVVTARGKIARLWPLAEARELLKMEGHEDVIRGLACSPDGRHLLTGGDTTARLWDLTTGKEVRKFKGHEKEVTSVAFSPDGRRVLTGSSDHTVRLWNVSDGQEILKFTQHAAPVTSVAYSPGGRRAASGSQDGSVRVWSLPP